MNTDQDNVSDDCLLTHSYTGYITLERKEYNILYHANYINVEGKD